jgi:hypothetical protein
MIICILLFNECVLCITMTWFFVSHELWYMGCIINIAEVHWKKRNTNANSIGMQFIRLTNLWGGKASVRSRPPETVNRPLLDGCKRRLLESLGCRSSDSCRKLFFNLEILPFPSQCILSFLLFMIKTGINLWSILKYITLTVGNMIIFTNLPWIWLNTSRECTL